MDDIACEGVYLLCTVANRIISAGMSFDCGCFGHFISI